MSTSRTDIPRRPRANTVTLTKYPLAKTFGAVRVTRHIDHATNYTLPSGVTIRVTDAGVTRKAPSGQGAWVDTGEVIPVTYVVFNASGYRVGDYKTMRGAVKAAARS